MADIFISYAREDANRVGQIIKCLLAAGFTVWWDGKIPAGAHWDTTIETELFGARSVLVLWSLRSVDSQNVRCEADWAREAAVIVPIKIEACDPPLFHRRTQLIDLSHWSGDADDQAWRLVLRRLKELTSKIGADQTDNPRAQLKRWGFGIAPPKPHTWRQYNDAVRYVTALAQARAVEDRDLALNSISIVKGLFNRSRKKDQWDWFIIWQRFGFPTMAHLRKLVEGLEDLRSAIKEGDQTLIQTKTSFIKKQNIVGLAHRFLGEKEVPKSDTGGVLYVLSTREASDVLIVGVTQQDVVEVADEVTRTMGARAPIGILHAFRVHNAVRSRDAIFTDLSRKGMTSPLDRVFGEHKVLECEAQKAISLIDSALKSADLLET